MRELRLQVQVIKSVLRGNVNWEPDSLPPLQNHWEGFVCLVHGAFNSPMWPVKSLMALEERTVDYRELNKVMSPIQVAEPNIATMLDNLASHRNLANVFFSIPLAFRSQGQFAFPGRVKNRLFQSFLKAIYIALPYAMEW